MYLCGVRLFDRLVDALAAAIARRLELSNARVVASVPSASADAERSPIQPFVDEIEWEPLARPLAAHVVRVGTTPGKFGAISVRRDAEYRLSVSVATAGTAPWTEGHLTGIPGSLNEGMEIEAEDVPGRKILLPNAVVSSTSTSFPRYSSGTTNVDVHAHRLVRTYEAGAPTLLVDWFISGPSETLTFWRVTERRRSESYTRVRRGFSADAEEHRFASGPPPAGTSGGSSRDYVLLDLPTGAVRLSRVPKENAPTWGRPIAIEHAMRDTEPSEDVRDGIVEALGFMFGRHIMRVGTTVFDDAGSSIREEAISP